MRAIVKFDCSVRHYRSNNRGFRTAKGSRVSILLRIDEMLVFHGSHREQIELMAGSWITTDITAAWDFAVGKTNEVGGLAFVMGVEVDPDDDVEWDILSAMAGVADERGILKRRMSAIVVPFDSELKSILCKRRFPPISTKRWRQL